MICSNSPHQTHKINFIVSPLSIKAVKPQSIENQLFSINSINSCNSVLIRLSHDILSMPANINDMRKCEIAYEQQHANRQQSVSKWNAAGMFACHNSQVF